MPVRHDPLERLLGLVDFGRRSVQEIDTRISVRDHRGQRLSGLVGDGRRDGVARRQPRLPLAPLRAYSKQPVHHDDLVKQHEQD